MAKENKNKKSPGKSPSDLGQKIRTFRNKLRQRQRHARLYPNDYDSLNRAQRWTTK